jgi:hypothetical protein
MLRGAASAVRDAAALHVAGIAATAQTATKRPLPPIPKTIKQRDRRNWKPPAMQQKQSQRSLSRSSRRDRGHRPGSRQTQPATDRCIAARVRDVETNISDTEARLRPLDARELQIRAALGSTPR